MSEDIEDPIDTSHWTEEDWYQNNIKAGMDEVDARFAAAQEAGGIDTASSEVYY